jgi:prolyl-tRNA editing enzyme YbaK/EbsC (Cys-tRNA(Pro) deacylase)
VKSALDVHRELLARDVPHEMVRLPGRATSADDLPRLLGLPTGCVAVRCYVVVREQGESFAAVLVPAGRLPEPRALLEALGARAIRAARPDQVNAVTDYAASLVGPFCLPSEVELLADSALGDSDVSYCAAGESEVVLGIRTRDLLVATGARAASLSGPGTGPGTGLVLAEVLDLERWARARNTA